MGIIDGALKVVSQIVKANVRDMCALESVCGPTTFVAIDSSLVTFVDVRGMTAIPGDEEYRDAHSRLVNALASRLKAPGHSLQAVYQRDPAHTPRAIAEAIRPSKDTHKRLNMDAAVLHESTVRQLSRWCVDERTYFVLWTHPASVSQEIIKKAGVEAKNARAKSGVFAPDAIDPFVFIEVLRAKHDSYVEGVIQALNGAKIKAEKMSVEVALKEMRYSIDPDHTSQDWRPLLPGGKITPRETPVTQKKRQAGKGAADASDVAYPKIGDQVAPRPIVKNEDGRGYCQVGDMFYAPMTMELFPQSPMQFAALFTSIPEHVPYRVSFHVGSMNDGGVLALKQTLATFSAFASARNAAIRDTIKKMKDQMSLGKPFATLRVTFVTWAKSTDELHGRAAALAQAVQSWGQGDIRADAADPAETMLKSAPGMHPFPPITRGYPPLSEAVAMLPIDRPASDWKAGSILFRTEDGVIWPWEPGSSKQTRWNELVFAPPGMGKSVLSNAINLAILGKAGMERLPRLVILDIGHSSKGMINLIRHMLPENQRDLVLEHRMVNSISEAINPFDLQLGQRVPTSMHRSFLVNLLTTLATPVGRDTPYENMAELAAMTVDELYNHYADQNYAKRYTKGTDPRVDKAIAEAGIGYDEDTSWWEIRDAFFAKRNIDMAEISQRYAVPVMNDAVAAMNANETIKATYGGIQAESGEQLTVAFGRLIGAAIGSYPIFAKPTVLNIRKARIIAMDLQDVAPFGDGPAKRQTAVMYMTARFVAAQDFYLHAEMLGTFDQPYKAFQAERIEGIHNDVKRLVYDEFHRTGRISTVRDQVVVDKREGRKHNVQVALISQDISDFDDIMVRLASSIFIVGSSSPGDVEELARRFKLGASQKAALLNGKVHGPRAGGSSFLFLYETKDGWSSQVLKNTRAPEELWALSTTREDNDLLKRLTQQFDYSRALKMLADRFPNGSAKEYIEEVANRPDVVARAGGDVATGAIGVVVRELVDRERDRAA